MSSKSGGVHHSYTFQCGLVGYFTSPGINTRYKGPTALSVSSERHWQSGVNGIAKVPKQSFPQRDSNPIRTVWSPAQASALTHSAIAPSTPSRPPLGQAAPFFSSPVQMSRLRSHLFVSVVNNLNYRQRLNERVGPTLGYVNLERKQLAENSTPILL